MQRSQLAVAQLNRLRSIRTQVVMMCGQSKLNRHATSKAVGSCQLLNLEVCAAEGVGQYARVFGWRGGPRLHMAQFLLPLAYSAYSSSFCGVSKISLK
ncbi:hypothetical protein ACVBEH_21945, partial [Roseateles sp. GG27B]